MKHFIFKFIIAFWKFFPFKNIIKIIINSNDFIKEKLYQDLRFKGNMKISFENKTITLYNPGITTIENEIYWNGLGNGWEKISINLWKKLAVNANTILDIGANTGIYSFVAATTNPNAKIYAFEPVKRTAEIFKRNISLNPSLNITLIEKAVSEKNGKAIFYDLNTDSQYSASLNKNMLEGYENRISYEVDTIQLDTFEELKNKKIDLIKLDVEMHEPEALKGMFEIIQKHKPSMLIEILNDEIAQKIEEIIENLGYLFYSIDEVNLPIKMQHLKKSGHYNFLICQKEIAKKLQLN